MNYKLLGIILLLVGVSVAGVVTYYNGSKRQTPLVFSKEGMLGEIYVRYKQEYVEPSSGRTLDKQRENITTSEGQSYTMLRAVWQDDQATFDKTWDFNKNNLKRPNDRLMSWMYGKRADGSFGVLTDKGGQNTASDGDIDTALALLFASERWQKREYLDQAKAIVNDIWEQEVVTAGGRPVLAANNLEKASASETIIVNPSYFSPASYRIFAKIDTKHDWQALANHSYDLLDQASTAALDTSKSSGLPPDWILVNRRDGAITPTGRADLKTTYGYDAMRVSWRLALDWQWFKEPRAKQTLKRFGFLGDQWRDKQAVKAEYAHDGRVTGDYEAPAVYGGDIGYFTVIDQGAGDALYDTKLKALYDPNRQGWRETLSYYDDNWAWFGLALHDGATQNLAEDIAS